MNERVGALALIALAITAASTASGQAFPLAVNECSTGTSGWVEIVNRGAVAVELVQDPGHCWLVDDRDGAGAPKALTDTNVNHSAASTTCATRGRGPKCGVVGPGEVVWLQYAYLNSASDDECRLLSAPRLAGVCGSPAIDAGVGGPTAAAPAGQAPGQLCFGRQPDGGAWALGGMSCTQGLANTACTASTACDDGNPCTTGERFSADCSCAGGTPTDIGSCGAGKMCQAGACVPAAATDAAVITKRGTGGLLLLGTIVTPDSVIQGEVLIVGEQIACVKASCQDLPAAATATVVNTNGVIYPGLIDAHNHIQFDIFDEDDWAPEAADDFQDHDDWPRKARYKALVDAKQYLNGEGSPVRIGCELVKYGELKGIIAGTTSIVSAAIQPDQRCFGSLARTIDQRPNGLPQDRVQTATPFPSQATANRVCTNLAPGGNTDAYLIHIAEGVNPTAHREFEKLFNITTTPGCLYWPKTAIVHGTALNEADFVTMATHQMGLVWSPRSNVFLYGHGSDFTKTTNIPAALERGITVALAPDWSIGGSQNLLDELRFADQVDNAAWGDAISLPTLARLVTSNPAKLLALDAQLGRLAPGMQADIAVFAGDRSHPFETLMAATPKSVRLVLVGGKVMYGDATLQSLGEGTTPCEALDICGESKFACVATAGGTPANKLGQTYAEIRQVIDTELKKYDDLNRSAWDFSPIAPLYKCP